MLSRGRRGVLKFQVRGQLYGNVNFARLHAERIAEETGLPVVVYHNIDNRQGLELFTIRPKNRLTAEPN